MSGYSWSEGHTIGNSSYELAMVNMWNSLSIAESIVNFSHVWEFEVFDSSWIIFNLFNLFSIELYFKSKN